MEGWNGRRYTGIGAQVARQQGPGEEPLENFIYKGSGTALPISARDMSDAERRYFND